MRAYRNVIEQAEANGYPSFLGHQSTAEEKVGECASTFGGFSVYSDDNKVYILVVSFPFPEPVKITGKLTGEDYPLDIDGVNTGSLWMDINDAIKVFRSFADKLEYRKTR